jgi:hypothetical protein
MTDRQKIAALISLVDRLEQRIQASTRLPEHKWPKVFDRLWKKLVAARTRLLRSLAYADNMLVGTVYCNDCGEAVGVVTKVEREPDLVIITTAGDVYLGELYGNYFRLPGSDAYGDQALFELARQRAADAAVT